jgi:hypothetical protein
MKNDDTCEYLCLQEEPRDKMCCHRPFNERPRTKVSHESKWRGQGTRTRVPPMRLTSPTKCHRCRLRLSRRKDFVHSLQNFALHLAPIDKSCNPPTQKKNIYTTVTRSIGPQPCHCAHHRELSIKTTTKLPLPLPRRPMREPNPRASSLNEQPCAQTTCHPPSNRTTCYLHGL